MDVEILIHISAPTTRKADDRYRQEASAYLDFEPHGSNDNCTAYQLDGQTKQVTSIGLPLGRYSTLGTNKTKESEKNASSESLYGTPPSMVISEDSYGSFLSTVPRTCDPPSDSGDSDAETTPSDSSRRNSGVGRLEVIQVQWKKKGRSVGENYVLNHSPSNPPIYEADTQLAASSIESQLYRCSSPAGLSLASGPIKRKSEERHFLSPKRRRSFPPGSNSFAKSFPTNLIKKAMGNGPKGGEAGPTSSRFSSPSSSEPLSSAPIPSGAISSTPLPPVSTSPRSTNQEPPAQTAAAAAAQTSSSSGLSGSRTAEDLLRSMFAGSEELAATRPSPNPAPKHFRSLPTEVFPPAPATSLGWHSKLPSQVTPLLNTVMRTLPGNFHPERVERDVAPDERGHWLVETSMWPPMIQLDFWNMLTGYIRDGHLGWGVNLQREPTTLADGRRVRGIGTIRLFCWGELIAYTYSLLLICSSGLTSGNALMWLDAEDTPVVQMGCG